ncbi:MAG TPA: SlyX family protein [Polyangiaceae bacterium]|nr:SlyX family protein [Polyangiaceae bacterium]
MSSDEERMLRIETKIAYQDKLIADLNDVIVDLNRTVRDYARRLETVERAFRNELERRDMPNEKPPHY